MDTTNVSQSTPAKTITIENIELHNPARRKYPIARKYLVQFCVGDSLRLTNTAKEVKNRTAWDNKFEFDGEDNSVLLVHVYQKHHLGSDELLGSFMETIGSAFAKWKDGVLQDTLRKHSPDRAELSIKFAFVVRLRGNVSADERQAVDVHDKAIVSVKSPSSIPAPVDVLSAAVDASSNVATDVQTFEATWNVLLQRVELVDKIVTSIAQIHPYASMAWSVISAANKVVINQKNRDDRIMRLAATMSDAFAFVHDAEPLKTIEAHVKTFTLVVKQVTECGYFIADYAKQKNFWIRTAKYTISDFDEKIKGYEDKFREFKTAFLERISLQTEIAVVRMMNVVQDSEKSVKLIVLDDMPYASGARYSPEKGCLPETREGLLQQICDILNNANEDAPRLCLLTGVAGSGKSAVAHSIARLYDQQKRLGSSYCFTRTDTTTRNPQNLFSTIARDLCDHATQYKTALWEVVKDDRSLRTSQSPFVQVESLIIKPSEALHAVGPLVIVIDALDESGDRVDREDLLRVISDKITVLPTNLRFLITTRPEDDILNAFPSTPEIVHIQISNIPEEVVDNDIERFIYHSLHHYPELESSWPDREWCRLLVHHSQHLFQWASTACKFIRGLGFVGFDPCEQLEKLLQGTSSRGIHSLDSLYRTVLNQLFTSDDAREHFCMVMAIVLALHEPLSLSSLTALLHRDLNVQAIIKPMGSLLDGVIDETKPIRPLHTSFHDFLLDETRSSALFYVSVTSQHSLLLGRALLACMQNMLHFNICDLKDSQYLNSTIVDLPSQVNRAIPPHLAYSCQYWMHHLQLADYTLVLMNEVALFFKTCFPYWLEAISLLSLSSPLSSILSALEICTILKKWAQDSEIATLATEAYRFIQVFAPVLRRSTPHLYLSAMPQIPFSSPLCKLFSHLQKKASATLGQPTGWPAEVLLLQGHTEPVVSVAYSPDGMHIASGSEDRTIRIWNATTGQCIAGPFLGHKDEVCSVAYSSDGTHIVSGSEDKTIRIWNATTGQCVAGPFMGHTDGVTSVAYSPHGIHVVSGAVDGTIRVWNAATGQCVAGPFEGHTDVVHSVAYSPNGAHILSGSSDRTIRVWDATTGQSVAGPFQGHTNIINSVAYSSNGCFVVSSSDDKSVRVWSAATGQLAMDPFQAHTDWVWTAVYSPDGKHIASGSKDSLIRIWDATTGHCVGSPLQGHIQDIISLAFSPDGTHIVSGSGDKTIRIWEVTMNPPIEDSFQGHTDFVYSVAYSPDGCYIASGSRDMTIRIWDASTGKCAVGPCLGHTMGVYFIAYSPDGTHIVSGSWDKTIRIWSATTGQCVAGPFEGHTDYVISVAYSPDGTHIVSASMDQTVKVWNATTGHCVAGPFEGHRGGAAIAVYSPNGRQIASGSVDGLIRIWDVATGQCVAKLEGHSTIACSISYSPDGAHIVSGSQDNTIRVWDAITGQCVLGPLEGHSSAVVCVAYSPDGAHLVSGGHDMSIRVWNGITGQCVAGPIQGHTNSICSIAYSPDGAHIVTGSRDKYIKVWKMQDLLSFGDLLEKDSWLQSSDGTCFSWIAPWNRNSLQLPIHSLVIPSDRAYQVDLSDTFLGESWTSCWT